MSMGPTAGIKRRDIAVIAKWVGRGRGNAPAGRTPSVRSTVRPYFRVDAARPKRATGDASDAEQHRLADGPDADSRDMAMDANGELIEHRRRWYDRRTKPLANNGDWFSMNGDLQITSFLRSRGTGTRI